MVLEWIPHAELASIVTSPLASSTIPIPKYIHAPARFKQHLHLDDFTPRIQEAFIIEDLLFVLMGCEGAYIRFSDTYDPSIQFDTLKGPDFRINKTLTTSLKDITKNIIAMASHHMSLKAFVDVQSKKEYGLVNQALCASLRKVLKDYYLLVAQLEHQLYHNKAFSLQSFQLQLNPMAHILHQAYELSQVILKENSKKSEEAARSFNDFDKVIESLKIGDGTNLNELGMNVSSTKSTVCKGGTILRILAERLASFSGDPATRTLLKQLLADASKPYLKMLEQWIHKGVITDPCDEFLIREQRSIKRERLEMDYTDEYWDKRYTVRKDDLPLELSSTQVYERILLTGKYLNVVRECGGIDASKDVTNEYESIGDSRILKTLAAAYNHANKSLLALLIQTHDLPARLRSLKHYFFLDQADFFINFMDIAEKELAKPSQKASKAKLQYLLDMSLRQPGSISSNDPFKEDVIVDITHTSVTDYLLKIVSVTGMDPNEALGFAANGRHGEAAMERMLKSEGQNNGGTAGGEERKSSNSRFSAIQGLQLDFKIPFPLSLVLSRKTILRYQLLFRHLVELKHIERMLNNSWVDQKKSVVWNHVSSNTALERWKMGATRLRVKMLLFVQQILYYCTMEVMEPNWAKLQKNLGGEAKTTADYLMEQHVLYLDTCMKECMLTNEKLLKLQNKLFAACRLFGEYLLQRGKTTLAFVDTDVVEKQPGSNEQLPRRRPVDKNGDEISADDLVKWLESSLHQYENSFDHHLRVLMEALNYYAATETTVLLSLCSQLEVSLPAGMPFSK